MANVTLVVMAAGMGSRFGGLKQIEPVGANGNIIMDYSIIDAKNAGFNKVVFIIKEELLDSFKEVIGDRVAKFIDVEYAFQSTSVLPDGYNIDKSRTKPLGTAHAVYCAKNAVNEPFAVINADDYYGKEAYIKMYNFLSTAKDDEKYNYSMVAYRLKNTLTENGTVSRGVCETSNDILDTVVERTTIRGNDTISEYFENDTWNSLDSNSFVSMNFWGFTPSFFTELENGLKNFISEELPQNPMKGEYYLPFAVDNLIQKNKAKVTVLKTEDKWYGVTYKEDKPAIVNFIHEMTKKGEY